MRFLLLAARVAVLSHGAWLRHFGGDPGIVGKSILLDDQAYSVIGIMPSNFGFPDEGVEIWCVLGFNLKQSGRGSHFLQAIGRLKPGVSLQQAQAEMNIIAERLSATYDQPGSRVRLVPLQEEVLDSGYLDASGKTRG